MAVKPDSTVLKRKLKGLFRYRKDRFGRTDLNLETAEFLELGVCELVKLYSAQSTNAYYNVKPRDFHEKMPATADFRLRHQRGVAL